ncbi:LysE family translocator [Methylobacterium indicum]|uniref:Threonine transporter RhtB n=1 Tax=Methylobacterium indicum TaxID=1775910 RepID=A0A8H8WZW7_9HYPH|nr:LysE family translocator [Methylobacterium indicum]BCM87641.1 threonine transporter RhtB [Methylobacterium indicum]
MDFHLWALFLIVFLSAAILPGPNVAFATAQALDHGFKKSFPGAIGFGLASGGHAAIVLSGLGIVIRDNQNILISLKILGVVYLLYMAWKMYSASSLVKTVQPVNYTKIQMFTGAVFVSFTNPKGIITNIVLFPTFISPSLPYIPQCTVLVATAIVVSTLVYAGYMLLAGQAVKIFSTKRRMSVVTSILYVIVALAIAFSL